MRVLVFFILIVLKGIFSISEIDLVYSRKTRLEAQAKNGDTKALAAQ
jgi:putative hemolysin